MKQDKNKSKTKQKQNKTQSKTQYITYIYLRTLRLHAPNLDGSHPGSSTHNGTSILQIRHFPNSVAHVGEVANIIPSFSVIQPNASIVATRHKEVLVELKRGNRRVMSGYSMEDCVFGQVKSDDPTI
jgi:hypothetical protein